MSRAAMIERQLAAIGITAQSVSLDEVEYSRLIDPANIVELEALSVANPGLKPVLAMVCEDVEAMRKPPPVDPPLGMVEISCDGFCWPNPGGAMGASAILKSGLVTKDVLQGYQASPDNTNNRAELLAAILGLQALTKPCRATVFTDSQYLAQGFETWRSHERPERINADLWTELNLAVGSHSVSIEWLSGRDARIVRADALARHAALPHLAPKVRDAMRAYDDARSPGPLYAWLTRRTAARAMR